jgi:hypothetical protein
MEQTFRINTPFLEGYGKMENNKPFELYRDGFYGQVKVDGSWRNEPVLNPGLFTEEKTQDWLVLGLVCTSG